MASIESNHVGLVAEPYGPGMSGDPTLTGGSGPSGSTDSPAPSGGQTAAPAASNVSDVDAIMSARMEEAEVFPARRQDIRAIITSLI